MTGEPHANTFRSIAQSQATFRITDLERQLLLQLREILDTKRHSMISLRFDSVSCKWYVYTGNLAVTCEANAPIKRIDTGK